MAERNLTPEQERDVESHAPYMKVFWTLLVLTVLEYAYARFLEGKITFAALVAGLMVLALTKAFLVGWFFMHLKFEGRWIYMMLVPVCFLAVVVVTGLAPDMAFHQFGFYESPAVAEH
jgi:cytochrome c oxidase subunit IV